MYKFVIVSIDGVFDSTYYNSTSEALTAAKHKTKNSGFPWYITAVKVS